MTGGVNSASLCYSQRLNMHNTLRRLPPKPFDLTSTAFLIVAFLTGIAGALQTPTLSLFRPTKSARPAMVGFFFTGSAIIGILVSQFLAGRSDRKGDRKSLIVFCCLLGVFACVVVCLGTATISFCCLLGCFLGSFGSTANPQMFALAREHADRTGREAVMFQLDTARGRCRLRG